MQREGDSSGEWLSLIGGATFNPHNNMFERPLARIRSPRPLNMRVMHPEKADAETP